MVKVILYTFNLTDPVIRRQFLLEEIEVEMLAAGLGTSSVVCEC